jgi:hypothetical protein
MLIKLVEIYKTSTTSEKGRFALREIFVESKNVTRVVSSNLSVKGQALPDGLNPEHDFSIVFLNEGYSSTEITVIGSMSDVSFEINKNKKRVLHG